MPELPDILVYVDCLATRLVNRQLERVRVASPFLVRSVDPPITAVEGRTVRALRRLGKRIVFEFDGGLFLVLHLMIAGRLHWSDAGPAPDTAPARRAHGGSDAGAARARSAPRGGRRALGWFHFSTGTLSLTEASTRQRAALHVVRVAAALAALDPGGIEPLEAGAAEFRARLSSENHTLKRALTDPRLLSGVGNAYSDEILHRARLSPMRQTRQLTGEEWNALHAATRSVLDEWTRRLREQCGEGFPEKVTAFHPEMAVHGRYRRPCPACGAPVQRIVYAENESNYCARCQTGGRLLADRALSRLLRGDGPRRLEDIEGG